MSSIIATAYLREDGLEMIRERASGKWYIRTTLDGSLDRTWYWSFRQDKWVRPFTTPAYEYLVEKEKADKVFSTLKHPGR